MADQSHLDILHQGVEAWNSWRAQNHLIRPDLSRADLSRADLREADLTGANLIGADLYKAKFREANLSEANLSGADLRGADLSDANLSGAYLIAAHLILADLREAKLFRAQLDKGTLSLANLSGANLSRADLSRVDLTNANLTDANLTDANLSIANLTDANLSGADLSRAILQFCFLVRTNLQASTLTDCHIYGISVWDLTVSEETEQSNLVITHKLEKDTFVTVDDLEVAQFVYLLLDNKKLRNVIETMTSKAVLILGNFAPKRKQVLEAIKERLRYRDYLPILFDFEGPQNQRFKDTVTTVARLSRFVIADLTQSRSVTAELEAIVESLPLLPIQPLIVRTEDPPQAFIQDVVGSDSVLKLHRYTSSQDLLASLDEAIIAPAHKKRDELEVKRLQAIKEKL